MIGMDFVSCLILLIISIVVSGVLHYGLKYYLVPGCASYCSKIVVGRIGGWLGSPVLGRWWEGLNYQEICIVPAILGSLALLVVAVNIGRMVTGGAAKE